MSFSRLRYALGVLAVGLGTQAHSILFLDSSFGVQDLDYQRLAQQSPFQAVGRFDYTENSSEFVASGTLINPDWVLTAGHNFGVGATVTGTFTIGGVSRTFSSAAIFHHPSWASSPEVGPTQGADIALVRLDSPFTGVTPARIATNANFVGQTAITVGYGAYGTGLNASTPSDGTKRAMMNVIDRMFNTPFNGDGPQGGIIVSDFDNGNANRNTLDRASVLANDPGFALYNQSYSNLSDIFLPDGQISAAGFTGLPTARDLFGDMDLPEVWLEGGTAPGDSGGPTFVEVDGSWEIIGITSWGENPVFADDAMRVQGRYGDLSVLTDATAHHTWVVETVPEPGTMAALALGALALLRRRRKV